MTICSHLQFVVNQICSQSQFVVACNHLLQIWSQIQKNLVPRILWPKLHSFPSIFLDLECCSNYLHAHIIFMWPWYVLCTSKFRTRYSASVCHASWDLAASWPNSLKFLLHEENVWTDIHYSLQFIVLLVTCSWSVNSYHPLKVERKAMSLSSMPSTLRVQLAFRVSSYRLVCLYRFTLTWDGFSQAVW
jgi:hypothetical protein